MKRLFLVAALSVFLLPGCSKESEPVTATVRADVPAAFVAGAESSVMTSAITGRKYQVTVAVPPNYATTNQTYPVLYATDANISFGTIVETARLLTFDKLIPELIIVGVGWPVGYGINTVGPRTVDLTPTTDAAWMEWANRELPKGGLPAPEGSGGGGGFLRFIREEVIPSVEQKYRIERNDRAYYGFSLGGLFGTYALLNNEGTFQRFIIGSPSLWWNNRVIFDQEKAYAQTHKTLPARVFFSVGLDEESEYDNTGFKFASVSTLREFVRVLTERHYDGLTIGTHYFEGERHNSVSGATISRGLRFIYAEQ